MSEFEEQVAPDIPVRIGANEYLFSPLRYRDHAEAARRMRAGWRRPLEVVQRIGAGMAPEQQRYLLELAYRDERRGESADLRDVFEWYGTPDGHLYRTWMMLRRRQPHLTIEDVDELIACANQKEQLDVEEASTEADGLPLGNSSSPESPGMNRDQETFPGGESLVV